MNYRSVTAYGWSEPIPDERLPSAVATPGNLKGLRID
jgi:hypothetical protein